MNSFVRSFLIVRGNEYSLKHFLLDACNGWVSKTSRSIIIKHLQNVAGTHNGYILYGPEIPLENLKNGIVLLPFIQRWYINLKDIKLMSTFYNINLTVFVFENRMKNYREIDVFDGKIVDNHIINCKDFLWQLLFSNEIGIYCWLNKAISKNYVPTKEAAKTPNEFLKEKEPDELKLNGVVPV